MDMNDINDMGDIGDMDMNNDKLHHQSELNPTHYYQEIENQLPYQDLEIEPTLNTDVKDNEEMNNNENMGDIDNNLNNTSMQNDNNDNEIFMPDDNLIPDNDMVHESIDLMDNYEDVNIDINDQNDINNDQDLDIVEQEDKNKKKTQVLAIN